MKFIFLYGFYTIGLIATVTFIASCKKGNGDKPGNNKKIASMIINNRNVVYTYDMQGRLQRIDNGVDAYTIFEHSAAGIIMQQYDAAGNPMPGGRNQLNVVNGRIVTAKEFTNNNGEVKNHSYEYDGEGRLIRHWIRQVFEPTQQESHIVQYIYTYTGNNANHVTYLHKNGGDTHDNDSISIDLSYYDGKKLYTYADMGFNYFGTVPVGMQHQGHGIPSPINRLISLFYFPANNPIKSEKNTSYRWNMAQNKWELNNTQNINIPETEYEHNTEGYLIKCGGNEIKWQ